MARYRLRFQLQEFDLPAGITLIGRSLDCHVTIEDPLVSRQHARIVIDGDDATLEDLGSRNGVKLNGIPIRGSALLKDGDRIRIGTQELVVSCVARDELRSTKTTGVLRLCARCKLPYPRELVGCPSCGATEQTEDDTLNGATDLSGPARRTWSVQLLIEAIQRALALGRVPDAERLLQRVSLQFEEMLNEGLTVDAAQLEAVASQALQVSQELSTPSWAAYVTQLYRRARRVPPLAIVESLEGWVRPSETLVEAVGELVSTLHASDLASTDEERQTLARLERTTGLWRATGVRVSPDTAPG